MLELVLPIVARLRWAARRDELGALPLPLDGSRTHARGRSSDRILIFGSGLAVGLGVVTHDLAIPGSLARTLSGSTGRGADVDVEVDPRLTMRSIHSRLNDVALQRYDAIIVVLGLGEALQLIRLSAWARELSKLLTAVVAGAAPTAPIFVTSIPDIPSIPGYGATLGAGIRSHAMRMNEETAKIVSTFPQVSVATLSPPVPSAGFRTNYERWGHDLEAAIAPRLEAARSLNPDGVVHDLVTSEAQRRTHIELLKILGTGPEDRFDRVVAEARAVFGTSYAAFTIIDGDRLWMKSYVGGVMAPVVELAGSFTHATLAERGALIVPDALADPRFRDLPHVTEGPRIRFWAGFPIECAKGARVGTLSVFDDSPRAEDLTWHESVLRELALRIQAELA